MKPHVGQRPEIAAVGCVQRIKVTAARFAFEWSRLHVGQGELVQHGGQQDPPDPAVEIFEGVNPLQTPVGPRKEFGHARNVAFSGPDMPQPFGKIVAERADKAGHFIERRRCVRANLNVDVAMRNIPSQRRPCTCAARGRARRP